MAFYDWNRDGKKDFADDYIEYNIYKEGPKTMIIVTVIQVTITQTTTIPIIRDVVFGGGYLLFL